MISVPLTNSNLVAFVDDEDSFVLNYNWSLTTTGYARTYDNGEKLLHRMLLNYPNSDIDHKDGEGLNCSRKTNIRLATPNQNGYNQKKQKNTISKYKGVTLNRNQWQVRIQVDGLRYCIGSFFDEVEAAKAYDKAAIENFGEFARLNFPVDARKDET